MTPEQIDERIALCENGDYICPGRITRAELLEVYRLARQALMIEEQTKALQRVLECARQVTAKAVDPASRMIYVEILADALDAYYATRNKTAE